MIQRFKGRGIDYSKKVDIYRNLVRRGMVFSIRQEGQVVAHTTELEMRDCEFIINRAGKKKALKTKIRNVHALIRGYIVQKGDGSENIGDRITYNPFIDSGFYLSGKEDIQEINTASRVNLNSSGVWAL